MRRLTVTLPVSFGLDFRETCPNVQHISTYTYFCTIAIIFSRIYLVIIYLLSH